jgi:hypothetical protein
VKTCSRCGELVAKQARFCPACGANTSAAPAVAQRRKVVTVVFADVVGSTALGERVDPETLKLGPIGGRIVAGVVNALLKADPNSYVHAEPAWTPLFANAQSKSFTMADLVRFTLGPSHA